MNHYFNTEIAKLCGVNAAIIFQNIHYWTQHNESNNINFIDGRYWMYNSIKSFSEQFKYLSERQISTAISKLINEGFVITGNYNKSAYNRTLWYALSDKGKSILQKCEMENSNASNEFDNDVESIITNTKTNNKNDDIKNQIPPAHEQEENADSGKNVEKLNCDNKSSKSTSSKETIKTIVEYLNTKANTKYKYQNKYTQRYIEERLSEGFVLEDFKLVIDKKSDNWIGTEWEQYLRPSTLFGNKFENYLNEKYKKSKEKEIEEKYSIFINRF